MTVDTTEQTGLPTRYYFPRPDVRLDLLIASERVTRCPYKGEAHYYSVRAGDQTAEDVVWYYRYPTPEVGAIANRLCFYSERVDALYVDGEPWPSPILHGRLEAHHGACTSGRRTDGNIRR